MSRRSSALRQRAQAPFNFRGPFGGGQFGGSGTFALPQFFDSGPLGTWSIPSVACPAYYRDSYAKFRFLAPSANPALSLRGTFQTSGNAEFFWKVNGVFQNSISTACTADVLTTIPFSPVCAKGAVIELVGSMQFSVKDVIGITTYISGPPPAPTRLIVMGDSITQGAAATPRQQCWENQLSDSPPSANWKMTNMGFNGLTVGQYGNPSLAAQLANSFLLRANGTTRNILLIALGINDFENGVTLANFTTTYTAMITGVRLVFPTAPLFIVSPLVTAANDTQVNAAGNTMPQFRTAIGTVMAGFSNNFILNGLPIMTNADQTDNIHPNNVGHGKYFAAVKAALLAQYGA